MRFPAAIACQRTFDAPAVRSKNGDDAAGTEARIGGQRAPAKKLGDAGWDSAPSLRRHPGVEKSAWSSVADRSLSQMRRSSQAHREARAEDQGVRPLADLKKSRLYGVGSDPMSVTPRQ